MDRLSVLLVEVRGDMWHGGDAGRTGNWDGMHCTFCYHGEHAFRLVSSLVVGREERLAASLLHRTWSRAGRMLLRKRPFSLWRKSIWYFGSQHLYLACFLFSSPLLIPSKGWTEAIVWLIRIAGARDESHVWCHSDQVIRAYHRPASITIP